MSEFDLKACVEAVERYGNWIGEAQAAGDLAECRRRVELYIVWLEQQKQLAPASVHTGMESIIAELRSRVAGFPRSTGGNPPVQGLPGRQAGESSYSEIIRQRGEESCREFEANLQLLPAAFAQNITFCLAASRGIPEPQMQATWDQRLVYILKFFMRAIVTQDAVLFAEMSQHLLQWGQNTGLHPGFDRSEVLYKLDHAFDVFLEDGNPVQPSGPRFVGILSGIVRALMFCKKMKKMTDAAKPWNKMLSDFGDEMETIRFLS